MDFVQALVFSLASRRILISSPAASFFGVALLPSALPTFLAVISIIYTISLPLKLLHCLCTMEAAVASQACSTDV